MTALRRLQQRHLARMLRRFAVALTRRKRPQDPTRQIEMARTIAPADGHDRSGWFKTGKDKAR